MNVTTVSSQQNSTNATTADNVVTDTTAAFIAVVTTQGDAADDVKTTFEQVRRRPTTIQEDNVTPTNQENIKAVVTKGDDVTYVDADVTVGDDSKLSVTEAVTETDDGLSFMESQKRHLLIIPVVLGGIPLLGFIYCIVRSFVCQKKVANLPNQNSVKNDAKK